MYLTTCNGSEDVSTCISQFACSFVSHEIYLLNKRERKGRLKPRSPFCFAIDFRQRRTNKPNRSKGNWNGMKIVILYYSVLSIITLITLRHILGQFSWLGEDSAMN